MHLDVRDLRFLSALLGASSLQGVARRLGVSPSAVSHHLSSLETRLDLCLWSKAGSRSAPTPAASRLGSRSTALLQALSAAASDVGATFSGRRTLRLGLFCFSSCYFLGSLLNELHPLHPAVELTLVGAATDQPLVALDEGAADLVVVPEPLGPSRLPRVPLGWVDDVAVVSKDGWTNRTSIRARDFEDQVLICHRLPSCSWKDEFRLPFEIVPAGALAVAFTDVLVHLVRSGGGVAIVPRWVIELHPLRSDLISLQIGHRGVRRRWYLFLAPGLTEDLVVNDVREILARHLGATAD